MFVYKFEIFLLPGLHFSLYKKNIKIFLLKTFYGTIEKIPRGNLTKNYMKINKMLSEEAKQNHSKKEPSLLFRITLRHLKPEGPRYNLDDIEATGKCELINENLQY